MKKKKKKWLVITGIVLVVAVLVSFLVYFGVNTLFSMISDSFYESGVVIIEPGTTPSGEPSGPDGNQDGAETSPDVTAPDSQGTATQNPAGKDASSGSRAIPFDKLNLTMEEFKVLQQKVPFSDKVAALSILSAGLSASDYTELFGMLGGGITSDEVRRAYKIVSRGLSSEDKEKIWGYYDKYKHLIQ